MNQKKKEKAAKLPGHAGDGDLPAAGDEPDRVCGQYSHPRTRDLP